MAYIGTRVRLYASQVNANAMGLERTAGRLKALRDGLRRHKKLSDPERKDNLKWALAKLEDTKKNIDAEAKELGVRYEVYDNMSMSCLLNRMGKFMGVVASVTAMFSHIKHILAERCSHLHIFGVIAGTAALVAASFHIADRFFSRDLDESVYNTKAVVDKCHRALSIELEDFGEAPVEKK